jgi:hypothetical protein
MKIQLDASVAVVKGHGVVVLISEHQGNTEIVVQGKQHRIRILNCKEGLSVGTPVKVKKGDRFP